MPLESITVRLRWAGQTEPDRLMLQSDINGRRVRFTARAPGARSRQSPSGWSPKQVVLAGHDEVADGAVAAGERRAADDGDRAAGGLAEGELGG